MSQNSGTPRTLYGKVDECHPALGTQIPTCTVYGKTTVRKLQLSQTAFRPHDLHLCISNLPTFNTCNQTVTTLHVSTNSQHVLYHMSAKHDHVATVVAGTNLLLGNGSLLRVHCHHQCNEDYNACSHNTQILQKQTCKIQSKLDWIGCLKVKPRNSS
jgi:hypothetical protein